MSRGARFGLLALGVLACLGLAGAALDRAFPPDLTKLRHSALLVLAADGRPVAARGSADHFWRLATRPKDVDPRFIATLIATEDSRFWSMPGVDPVALARAALQDATAGRVVSGGSSITMQVVRLLMPHRRSWTWKCAEILRALQLSARYSKPDILAMYLTLAPYGGNIEGVQAAAWVYFGHGAAQLSATEIALLVALPRRPEALRPDRHPAAAVRAIARIYAEQHLGPAPAVLAGTISRRAFPSSAFYIAQHLWAQGGRGVLRSSIDPDLQSEATRIAGAAADGFSDHADVAILLIHNSDARIAAYVGGAGRDRPGGAIDMVQAIRSPGSTLKPFIYGMAFDRDVATPATLIDDTPLANATYDPADFDRSWHGVVPVAVALQQSYNLPAVKILQAVGPVAVVSTLRGAGMEIALPPADNHPSLAIALGGVGVRLADLGALYAGLDAGEAQLRPRLVDTAAQAQPAVMSAAAGREVLGILEGSPPPDGISGFGGRAVAYKTGTSYGFRDAWSIGVSADWTVAVWVGRPDGTPRPGAFGLNTAAPLMAQVFSVLPADRGLLPMPIVAPAATRPLAPSLAHFGVSDAVQSRPQIVFPPPNAAIEAEDGAPIALQATGGAAPYRWIVNGNELPPPPVGETPAWQPPSAGFFRITTIDQNRQIDSVIVQVK